MIVVDYNSKVAEMDFISLDLEPKMTSDVDTSSNTVVATAPTTTSSTEFYRNPIFKASILILFVAIMCFPHPKWLALVVSHPIGAIVLASVVCVVLIPELDWWVVVLAVITVYLLLAFTGLIETNLQNKRMKKEEMT
jgi:hypothetical protein